MRSGRGRWRVLLVALAALTFAGHVTASGAGRGAVACTPGVRSVGGATVRTFCGPAKGVAHAQGKTFHFSGGMCLVSRGYLTVNIGSITIGGPGVKPKFLYLGMDVRPPRDGKHANQIVSWQAPGKGYSLLGATVTVRGGLKRGSFTGRVIGDGPASGSFTC